MNQMPQINLLRGIAAVMVALFHFFGFSGIHGALFPEGGTVRTISEFGVNGVYLFFVISGFVIPWSMYHGQYQISKIFKFLAKRLVRLEPPYIASIVLMTLLGIYWSIKGTGTWHLNVPQLLLHIGYLIPFTGGKYEWINVIYWTLAIEFMYYIVLAFLFPLLNHTNRYFRYSFLLLFLAGPLISKSSAFLPLFMPSFLLGFILFLFLTQRMLKWEMLIWFVAAIVVIAFTRSPAVAVASAMGFFGIWLLRSDTKLGNGLGAISYSLYLIHGLTGNTYLAFFSSPDDSLAMRYTRVAIAFAFSIVSAIVFWYFVERVSKKWAQKIQL